MKRESSTRGREGERERERGRKGGRERVRSIHGSSALIAAPLPPPYKALLATVQWLYYCYGFLLVIYTSLSNCGI